MTDDINQLSMLAKVLAEYRKRLQSLQSDQNEAKWSADRALVAPISRTDLKAFAVAWLAETSGGFLARIAGRAKAHYGSVKPSELAPDHAMRVFSLFSGPRGSDAQVSAGELDQVLCGLFPGEIEAALLQAIDRMPWPDDAALTISEREVKAEEHRARLRELAVEEAELRKSIKELGLEDLIK